MSKTSNTISTTNKSKQIKKQTLSEYLKTFKSYPRLTNEESDRRYREAMIKKHAPHLA